MLLSLTVVGFNSATLDTNCNVEKEKFYFEVKSCIDGVHETKRYRSFKKACADYKEKSALIKKGTNQ